MSIGHILESFEKVSLIEKYFFRFIYNLTYHFYLLGSKDDTILEFQMISEKNFENLRLLKKKLFEFEDQLYEDVDGFHALRKIVTIFFSIFLSIIRFSRFEKYI